MTKRICDRCGKDCESLYVLRKKEMKVLGLVQQDFTIGSNGLYTDVDLCEECRKELKEWFNAKNHQI